MSYSTRPRKEILKFFEDNPNGCFTAKALIESGRIEAGEATVFRTLKYLTDEGLLTRFFNADGESAFYKLNTKSDCSSHYHLKCEECGRIFHVDCRLMKEAEKHIEEEHAFKINNAKSMLYGICAECAAKKGGNA